MSLSANPQEGDVLTFALEGGAGDGGAVLYALQPADATYLIKVPLDEEPGVFQVWSYVFSGRVDSHGRLILTVKLLLGKMGMKEGVWL